MDTVALATAEGTSTFCDRYRGEAAPDWYRGVAGMWTVSSVGIGTSLGELDPYTDDLLAESVVQGLELGCNLVDTAVHYRHQRSERAVGRALDAVFTSGKLRRNEVVVSTKGGTIPFDTFAAANPSRYLLDEFVLPGLLPEEEVVDRCHCVHPDYLEHELERSLGNLGLAGVDVYYLHNPEVQLDALPRAEFDRRIRAAFERLELKVSDGKIGIYGVASWGGLRRDPSSPSYLSLAELVQIARDVAGDDHHFRAIQVPINLMTPDAVTWANQTVATANVTLLDAATELGVAVFACGALAQGHLTEGLPAEVHDAMDGIATDAQRALQAVRSVPGIASIFVGMKRRKHIEENLALRSRAAEPWPNIARLFSPGA